MQTISASNSTAIPRANPIDLMTASGARMNPEKTLIMMIAAAVTTCGGGKLSGCGGWTWT